MKTITKKRSLEPTWEIARLFPMQGQWSVDDYLALDEGRIIELSHGHLEVHEVPTPMHQEIMIYLLFALRRFTEKHGLGKALCAPMPVQLQEGKFSEPDVIFMLAKNDNRRGKKFWIGADLVMEVVSPDNRGRDLRIKRREYAMAGIPEYWIVDPEEKQIIVLTLDDESYIEHGIFGEGTTATSLLLDGFGVAVDEVFAG